MFPFHEPSFKLIIVQNNSQQPYRTLLERYAPILHGQIKDLNGQRRVQTK